MTTTDVRLPEESVCYRHPDRESGLRCQRCGRTVSPECAVAAPVGVQCLACALGEQPGREATAPLAVLSRPYVAISLIALNVAVAVVCLLSDPNWTSGELGQLMRRGALVGGAVLVSRDSVEAVGVAHGEWYRVFTSAFLHGGPIHLAFNMFALWQAGLLLEGRLGRLHFAVVYAVAVLGGSFGALLVSPDSFTVGASGGVFGLFGALFVAERKGHFGRAGAGFGMLIVINLVITVAIPGISLGGHVGGLLAGTFAAWLIFEYRQRGLAEHVPLAVAGALCAMLFVGCLWAATLSSDALYRV